MTTPEPPPQLPPCPECGGKTIEFRGNTVNSSQYKVCSRYAEPGHKSLDECERLLREERRRICPSGRLA